jgi:hypothetical protein
MPWVTTKHIGGRSLFLVIDPVSQMEITLIPIVQGYQSALFLTTQKECTKLEPTRSVRRGITKS